MVVEGAGWPKGFVCNFLAPASMLMQDDHNNVWCLPTVHNTKLSPLGTKGIFTTYMYYSPMSMIACAYM